MEIRIEELLVAFDGREHRGRALPLNLHEARSLDVRYGNAETAQRDERRVCGVVGNLQANGDPALHDAATAFTKLSKSGECCG